MDDRYLVSIDLGTSKIALSVAQVNNEDIQVIYYHETPAQGMSYSYIFNPQKAAEPLRKAIAHAEEQLKIKITQAVVGLPRYEVIQKSSRAGLERTDKESSISIEEINYLKNNAIDSYPLDDPSKESMFGVVAQSFSTDDCIHMLEADVEGMVSDSLEGDFKVFIGTKRHCANIDRVMNLCGVAVVNKYFTPETTAKATLTNEEMDNGVALIEIGAGATSVTVYQNRILRHFSSIPFGGKSITNDIKLECGISEKLAENIKLAYGACMPDKLLSLRDKIIQINNNESGASKQLSVKYLSEIITYRIQEIIEACLYKIEESGFADCLRNGIVITGGCAGIPNLSSLIKEMSGYNVRTGFPLHRFSFSGCSEINRTSATASAGMILAAKDNKWINCFSGTADIEINEEEVVEKIETVEIENAVEEEVKEIENKVETEIEEEEKDEVDVKEDEVNKKKAAGPIITWCKNVANNLRKNYDSMN